MEIPTQLELDGDFASWQPVGELTLDETTDAIDRALAYCRDNGIHGLLADVSGITGFPSPTVAERFFFINKWADTAAGRVVMALVARPQMILPDKFGATVASNRGFVSEPFDDREKAIEWLQTRLRA